MKFLHLIWRNASRNKRRAVLSVLSIAVAMVAICVLSAVVDAFNAGVDVANEARLIVRNSINIIFPLPLSYRQRLAAMPGVKSVTIENWFGGVYQDKKNFFARFACEAETFFPMYPEYAVDPREYQEFLQDRQGCIVGKKLAEQYGFKVGGTVPLEGDIFPGTWSFNVRGIYHAARSGIDETAMFFHWKYLDESVPQRRQSQVGWYVLLLDDPSQAGAIARTIDDQFENSPDQTITETEKAFQLEFAKMMGNVELLLRIIGAAVVFTLLLIAGNTMAMAARERTTEIAILKTIGFRSRHLAFLVVGESLLLTLSGWLLGWGVARLVCLFVESEFATMFPVFPLKSATVVLALGLALFTGVVSGLFPAIQAARVSVVNAMRKVA